MRFSAVLEWVDGVDFACVSLSNSFCATFRFLFLRLFLRLSGSCSSQSRSMTCFGILRRLFCS